MFKRLVLLSIPLFLFFTPLVHAEEPLLYESEVSIIQQVQKEEFYRAKVVEILREGKRNLGGYQNPYQVVKLKFINGSAKDEEVTFEHGEQGGLTSDKLVSEGEEVVVVKIPNEEGAVYQIIDKYRLPNLAYLIGFFFFVIILLSKWKGVGSIAGMILSLLIITYFIVPQIIKGADPLLISIIGSSAILISTMYLAHGFNKRTSIAIGGIVISLILTGILAVLFVHVSKLTGVANEDAAALQFGELSSINFKGLLLGGIIIGALGVLDDITTSLTASVFEIHKANAKLKFKELVASGMEIGKEHVSSLVNTLVLAYAGASLPLFLFIVLNPNNYPLWMILNSEMIVEEIVRTLAGSLGLIFAVPITTTLAAWFIVNQRFAKR
jgi:uncharacterized membrane protein